jgi:DNA-damage-inducible protein D
LRILLEYTKRRNFELVIEKAMVSCQTAGQNRAHHFAGIRKMVDLGSGNQREVDDYMLTRYACYLIAQNGDPQKEAIAFAQRYFAIQARKQEILEQRIALTERLQARQKLVATEIELSKNIYERGVDDQRFGRIRSKGDQALFGGLTPHAKYLTAENTKVAKAAIQKQKKMVHIFFVIFALFAVNRPANGGPVL